MQANEIHEVTPMDPRVKRFELPSGGWWELIVRPTWGDMKPITAKLRSAQMDGAEQEDQLDVIIAALTTAWSFDEDVEADTIANRQMADLIPVMKVVVDEIVPLFQTLTGSV